MKDKKALRQAVPEELTETAPEFGKWRRRLFIMNTVIATGVFLLEICVNVILAVQGKVDTAKAVNCNFNICHWNIPPEK